MHFRILSSISPQGSLQTDRAFSPTRGRILSIHFFHLFGRQKSTSGSAPKYPLKEASKQTGLFPLLGGVYYQYIFSTFLDDKKKNSPGLLRGRFFIWFPTTYRPSFYPVRCRVCTPLSFPPGVPYAMPGLLLRHSVCHFLRATSRPDSPPPVMPLYV